MVKTFATINLTQEQRAELCAWLAEGNLGGVFIPEDDELLECCVAGNPEQYAILLRLHRTKLDAAYETIRAARDAVNTAIASVPKPSPAHDALLEWMRRSVDALSPQHMLGLHIRHQTREKAPCTSESGFSGVVNEETETRPQGPSDCG